MPLPKYQDVLADPAFSNADTSRQREINDAYWNAYDKEIGDEYGKQQRVDTTAALDAKTRLEDAAPLERKALDLQRSAANYRIRARIGQKEGNLTQADVDAFGAEQQAITAKQEGLKKTYSMFSPEKQAEVEDFWNTASQTAADGGVFGATTNTSAFGEKDPQKEKEVYAQMRQGFAEEYGIAPEDVDSVVKHRMGLQEEAVSRDAFGTIHIKDDVLAKPIGDVEKAIKASDLPESVKEKALVESPQRIALFKARIMDQVKQQHPELYNSMGFIGDVENDYQGLIGQLNESAGAQLGESINTEFGLGRKAVRGVGLFADKIIEPLRANVEAFRDSKNYALDYADTLENEAKRVESLNQLSGQINKEKVRFLGTNTDAGVIGQAIGSAVESVTIGAATAGFGNAIVSAERIAKAGKFGKVALGFAKGVASTTPVAGYYGADQALSTYDQAIGAGKSEDEATKLAAISGSFEFGVTAFFGGTGAGGLEDIGQRLASGAVRKEVARNIWKSMGKFGKDVAGEVPEENIITALDTIYVQSKLNPGLTTDDLKKSLYDTTVATLAATGPLAGASATKDYFSKPTHEQTTEELHATSDARYTEEVLPEVQAERGTVPQSSPEAVAPTEQMTTTEFQEAVTERVAELEATENPTEEDAAELAELKLPVEEAAQARGVELVDEAPTTPPVGETISPEPTAPLPEATVSPEGKGGTTSLETVTQKASDNGVDLRVEENTSGIQLSGIEVNPDVRRQGRATQVISDLKEVADEKQLPISLKVEPSDEMSAATLENFYAKQGFVMQEDGETMVYKPAVVEPTTAEVVASSVPPETQTTPAQTSNTDVSTEPNESQISAAVEAAPVTVAEETDTDPDLEALSQELAKAFGIELGETLPDDGNGQMRLLQEAEPQNPLQDHPDLGVGIGGGERDSSLQSRVLNLSQRMQRGYPEIYATIQSSLPENLKPAAVYATGIRTNIYEHIGDLPHRMGSSELRASVSKIESNSTRYAGIGKLEYELKEQEENNAAFQVATRTEKSGGKYDIREARNSSEFPAELKKARDLNMLLDGSYAALYSRLQSFTPLQAAGRNMAIAFGMQRYGLYQNIGKKIQEFFDVAEAAGIKPEELYKYGFDVRGVGNLSRTNNELKQQWEKNKEFLEKGLADPSLGGVVQQQLRQQISHADLEAPLETLDRLIEKMKSGVHVLNQNPNDPKGVISFRGLSQAVITLLKTADPSTATHEMAHLARRFLFNKDIPQAQREGVTDEDINTLEKWAGVKDGVWNTKAEEKFARGFERYVRDGVFPENSKVAELFKKISNWLQKIYATVEGSSINVEITPEVKALFDKLVTRGETVTAPTKVAAKVVVEPKAKAPAPAKKKLPPVRRPGTFGAKREITDEVRKRYGIPESYLKASMTDQEAIDGATLLIARSEARLRDPSLPAVQPVGEALVAAILEDPTRAPSKAETALLVHESIKREMALDVARKDHKALPPTASEGDNQVAVNEVKRARAALEEILNVLQLRGSRAGLALQGYKLITDRQFNLSVMEADFLSWKNDHEDGKGARKEALTDAEVAQIEAAHDEVKKWRERVTELEAEISEGARREAALIERLSKGVATKNKVATRNPIPKAEVKSALDFLRSRGVSVLSQTPDILYQGEYQSGNNLDPDIIDALATVGASYIQEGDSSLEAFSKRLNEQFDGEFKASADLILEASRAKLSTKSKKRAKTPKELSNLIDKENPKLSNRLVYNVALGFIRQGAKGKTILDSTLRLLQKDFPNLTREDVAIAFTGYGSVKFPDPAADKKALREIREIERLELQLADVLKGVPALKTGQQRDKSTDKARDLQKQIREAYRAMGIKRATSRNQLGGSLDAMKTRLSNELSDLNNAIATRVKLIKDKTKVEVDEEVIRLREKVAQARKDYNAIFPIDRSLTEKQQIDRVNKALDRRIAEEEELARKGLVDRILSKSKPVTAAEVEARRKKLNGLVEARRKAKAARIPKISELDLAIKASETTARRVLKHYEDIIAGIKKAAKAPFEIVPGEDLANLWDLRDAAKATVVEMRQIEREMRRKSPEQIAYAARLRSLEKTVADLESRAKRGDISKKGKVLGPDTLEVSELKKRADAARAVIEALRAATDPRTPEQKKDDALVRASKTRKAKIEARIAADDYVDIPPVTRAESKELVQARFEERRAKDEWLKNRQKWNLANRGTLGKISYKLGSLWQFRKVLILGLDLLIFRQGIVPFMNRPIRTVRNLFKAIGAYSEANELDVYDSIMNPARNPYAKFHSVAKQMKFFGPFEEGFRNKEDLPDPEILNKLAKIPGLGTVSQIMLSLERINRVHFNLMANDAFNALLSIAPANAPTKSDILLAANAAMTAVGRGSFKNQRAETGIELANYALLSTRYYVARAKLVTLEPIWSTRGGFEGTLKMRSKIAFQLYGMALFNTALVMTLLARGFMDDDEREDFISPTSSKFGALKVNGTTYELLGGVRAFINLISRFVAGYKVQDGKVVSLAGEDAKYKQDLKEEWTRFWQNRRNINFALLFDVASRQQFDGSPTTVKSALTAAVLNINIENDIEIIKKHGKDSPIQAVVSIAAVHSSLNVRAEDYKPKEKKSADPFKSGF